MKRYCKSEPIHRLWIGCSWSYFILFWCIL